MTRKVANTSWQKLVLLVPTVAAGVLIGKYLLEEIPLALTGEFRNPPGRNKFKLSEVV
jgi:hypothetical protein